MEYTWAVETASSLPKSEQENEQFDAAPPSLAQVLLWIGTATVTGAIVMAMELTAFRLYAPYFGNSIYVWGSMISMVMLALAVGYSLGGWIADRKSTDALLYWIILGSGVYQLLIVFSMRPVLLAFWHMGDFLGPALATVIIFAPPMTALAMTSPFVIRLLARAGHVGITVGRVFSLSTAGSIAGVLGTSFYLVPRFGTRMTMEILCGASILVGAAGLMMRRKVAVLLAMPVALLFAVPPARLPAGFIWSGESAYNRILVFENAGFRSLLLNNTRYFQTIEKVGSDTSGFYLDEFALGPAIVPAKKLLVLGMGAGGSIRATRVVAPEIEIEAVEIDPEVVRVAVEFFGLPQGDAKLHVHIADARPWLAEHEVKSDLVNIDLFQGGPYVPFYLTTVEFFQLVRSRMTNDGVLMVNVYDESAKHELLEAIGATIRQVFPSLEKLSRADGNHILFAFPEKRELAKTRLQLEQGAGPAWVQELEKKASTEMVEFEPRAGAAIFTDDRAPIEEMTWRMLAEKSK
ncbi:MAG TPA: fused MFS/spermidine synthase [Candidatus Acidoferrum sp.]|nr:fused MFS/spermidine synthase [Candidatus Acidoferrum sp.]